MTKPLLCLLLLVTGLGTACSKKEPVEAAAPAEKPKAISVTAEAAPGDAPPPPSPNVTTVEAAPGAPDAAPATGAAPDDMKIAEEVQAALQAYYLANVNSPTRFAAPKSLDELVKGGYIKKIPAAPPGKKIVYHPESWQVTIEAGN